jgi:ParB/RepB/Spo0J family partition protein
MSIDSVSCGRGKSPYLIPLSKLVIPEGENCRKDFGDLNQLAKDLAENGQRIPLVVRMDGDTALISDGSRRFRAANIANKQYGAKITQLYCFIEDRGTDEKDRLINQISSNNGKPFEPVELGEACKKLVKLGVTIKDIATKLGRTTQTVRDYLKLAEDPEAVKDLVRQHKIKATTAKKMRKASPLKRETAQLRAELGGQVKGKDLDEDKPFSMSEFAKGLEKFGFKKASDTVEPGAYNSTIRLDQKDPAFIAMYVL